MDILFYRVPYLNIVLSYRCIVSPNDNTKLRQLDPLGLKLQTKLHSNRIQSTFLTQFFCPNGCKKLRSIILDQLNLKNG